MDRQKALENTRDKYNLLAVYLFGSRADDGLRLLRGETVEASGSDLDIGIVFSKDETNLLRLGGIQIDLSDIFIPLIVDVVHLQKVDPLFQFRAIDGHRITESDRHRADIFELEVMRRAAELLPVQRQLEKDLFGVSTS
jgi:predicted nucleotidyltransferase